MIVTDTAHKATGTHAIKLSTAPFSIRLRILLVEFRCEMPLIRIYGDKAEVCLYIALLYIWEEIRWTIPHSLLIALERFQSVIDFGISLAMCSIPSQNKIFVRWAEVFVLSGYNIFIKLSMKNVPIFIFLTNCRTKYK